MGRGENCCSSWRTQWMSWSAGGKALSGHTLTQHGASCPQLWLLPLLACRTTIFSLSLQWKLVDMGGQSSPHASSRIVCRLRHLLSSSLSFSLPFSFSPLSLSFCLASASLCTCKHHSRSEYLWSGGSSNASTSSWVTCSSSLSAIFTCHSLCH